MSDMFFLFVGIILVLMGLLLIASKVMTCIKCTVSINATVIKLKKEYNHYRGVEHTLYRPVVGYEVDGKNYSQTAPFRTYQKRKYPIGSEMKISYNPRKPEEIRFVGHPYPLPMGVVFLFFGAVLIYCYFI